MADIWHPVVMERGLSYPNMSDCMVVGIAGGCGTSCPVFQRRQCDVQEEMEAALLASHPPVQRPAPGIEACPMGLSVEPGPEGEAPSENPATKEPA